MEVGNNLALNCTEASELADGALLWGTPGSTLRCWIGVPHPTLIYSSRLLFWEHFPTFSLFSFTFQITEAGFLAHVFIPTLCIYIALKKHVGFTAKQWFPHDN